VPDPQTTTGKTLVSKLAEVMKEVGRIPKNGYNEHFKYKFVREADLVDKLSELLGERHVFITSLMKGFELLELPNKKCMLLRVEYTMRDGDSGETLTVDSFGEVEQDGGKGIYKALTGAMKYFLMKQFLVATGDDPEDEAAKTKAQTPPRAAPPPKQTLAKPLVAPLKPPAPKEKLPPTIIEVMEMMNGHAAKKEKALFQGAYDLAFKMPQSPENAKTLAECYVNGVCNMNGWISNGTKTQVFDGATLKADVVRDDRTGKVKLTPVAEKPQDVKKLEDEAMAEAERKGMQKQVLV